MTSFSALADRALLCLSGEGAAKFLHGLVTINVLSLKQGKWRYGMMLTPQGKFLHDFFLCSRNDALWMDVDAAGAEEFRQLLMRYRLRAPVEIALLPAHGVFAVWDTDVPPAPEEILCAPDPRLPAMGWRLAGEKEKTRAWLEKQGWAEEGEGAYGHRRLSQALPEGTRDLVPGKSLPMEFGMDALQAIDFDKGCYVGQEVTARSKFRAQLRKRVYRVTASAALPAAGTRLTMAGREVGEMGSSSGGEGLARIAVEAVEKAGSGQEKILAGELPVMPEIPAWAAMLDYSSEGESAG